MDTTQPINLKGLCCAQPIIAHAKGLGRMASGEVLLVLADKDSLRRDIPAFFRQTGHTLLASDERDGELRF